MTAFAPSLQFLHCLREYDHLEQSLREGLMFTSHLVEYDPASTSTNWGEMLNDVLPLLEGKLRQLGRPFESLSEERSKILLWGLRKVSAYMPMICLTEVAGGRDVGMHHYQFGNYGLFLSREWIEQQGADRVLYVGDKTALSARLFRMVATAKILGIHLRTDGEPLFETFVDRVAIDLLAYVETRVNIEELEWRIAGKHNIFGGGSDDGCRLPLPLQSIERIVVANADEVSKATELVEKLAAAQGVLSRPPVACYNGSR
jgi:hypothetical protein